VYGGHVYAHLRDARTGDAIDARVPEQLAAALDWNGEAVFVGLLRFKPGRGGVLKPEFRIDAVVEAGTARVPGKSDLVERWAAAAARPKRDVRAAVQGVWPRVAVITGVGSVAVDDIRAQLREAEADIELDVIRVPMTRPAEVARAVGQATAAHLIVMTRGGGEGVNALDDEDLIRAVAASPVPVGAAVGHASDYLVVGRVADAAFPTPTAFGGLAPGCLGRGPAAGAGRGTARPVPGGLGPAPRPGGRSRPVAADRNRCPGGPRGGSGLAFPTPVTAAPRPANSGAGLGPALKPMFAAAVYQTETRPVAGGAPPANDHGKDLRND
jgi:hypothetical protein